jgi:hypothetical protein
MSETTVEETGQENLRARRRQVKVCILGAKGAGKTCFLAGLAVLSEPNRESIVTAIHDDPETADYLDSLQATLRAGAWPPPTTATVVLNMTVMVEGAAVDLRVVDYDGEDFTGALRTLDRDSVEKLYQFTREADIFLLLFAPQRDLTDDGSAERAKTLIERQRAHLQAIAQVWREKVGREEPSIADLRPELGLVITQCDRVPGLDSPTAARKYFRDHAPHLVERLAEYASSVKCFALSAIGPPDVSGDPAKGGLGDRPPATINPYGYEPLFRWIRAYPSRRSWWWKRAVIGVAVAALAVVVGGLLVDNAMRSSRVSAVLDSPTLSDLEKVERSSGRVNRAAAQRRSDFLRDLLERLEERLKSATSDDDFQRLRGEASALAACDTDSFRGQYAEFAEKVRSRERRLRLDMLVDDYNAQPRPTAFVEQCRRFVDEYRSGDDVEKVRQMLVKVGDEIIRKRRDAIKEMPLGSSSQVAAKANAILEFTRDFERQLPEDEVVRMRKAAEIARLAAGQGRQGQWEVTLVRSGGLTVPYWQSVIISKTRGGEPIHTFEGAGDGATKDKTWSSSPVRIAWQAGEPLHVSLKIEGRVQDVDVGFLQDKGPMAIGLLLGRRSLNVEPGSEAYSNDPYVEFRVTGPDNIAVGRNDWQAAEDFIWPGNRW